MFARRASLFALALRPHGPQGRMVSNASNSKQTAKTAQSSPDKIQIPNKIERSPTAILEAIASTIRKDHSAPDYMFADDPYLIPTSSLQKRSYALAKASGKRAARHFLAKYPNLLFKDNADPSIPAYLPPKTTWPETMEPNEAAIFDCMQWGKLDKAYETYVKAKQEGARVSEECKLALFELACFFNSSDMEEDEPLEEKWAKKGVEDLKGKRRVQSANAWKSNSIADKMLEELADKSERAYCSLLKGLVNHGNYDQAVQVYRKMRDAKLVPDSQAYAALIGAVLYTQSEREERVNVITGYLKEMSKHGVAPTLEVFNQFLRVLSFGPKTNKYQNMALSVLREMKKLHIEPSLTSWTQLLLIFYPIDGKEYNSSVMRTVLSELTGKELEWRHPEDAEFFPIAMRKIAACLNDVDLAYELDALLNHGNNAAMLSSFAHVSLYYTNLFDVLMELETFDKVVALWEQLVPNTYSPNRFTMKNFIDLVDRCGAVQLIPRLWSDVVSFDGLSRATDGPMMVDRLLAIMIKHTEGDLADEWKSKFGEIVVGVQTRCPLVAEEQNDRRESRGRALNRMEWTAPMLGNLLLIALRCNGFDEAWKIFEVFSPKRASFVGSPSGRSLAALVAACVDREDVGKATSVLEAMDDLAVEEAKSSAQLLRGRADLALQEGQRALIDRILARKDKPVKIRIAETSLY